MAGNKQPKVGRGWLRDQVDEDHRIVVRLHTNRHLVGEVPGGLTWPGAKDQAGEFLQPEPVTQLALATIPVHCCWL